MNIQRSHIFGFMGLVGFAFALYWAKAEAQSAREQVVALQAQVDKERRAVRTLEAEVAWMERPDRLEATARQKMGLVPIAASNTASIADLDEVAPLVHTSLEALPAEMQTSPTKGPSKGPSEGPSEGPNEGVPTP